MRLLSSGVASTAAQGVKQMLASAADKSFGLAKLLPLLLGRGSSRGPSSLLFELAT